MQLQTTRFDCATRPSARPETFRLYAWRKPVFKFEVKDVPSIKHKYVI